MSEIDWESVCDAEADDWEAVMGECGGLDQCRPGPFKRADVAEVVRAHAIRGDDAEINMWAALRLKDGRYGYVEGWADTSGWGCQDGNAFAVADSLEELLPLMSDEGRSRLGFVAGLGSEAVREPGEASALTTSEATAAWLRTRMDEG